MPTQRLTVTVNGAVWPVQGRPLPPPPDDGDWLAWLVRHVAAEAGITAACVVSGQREPRCVAARAAVWQVLRAAGWQVTSLGTAFHIHHTTVLHGLKSETADTVAFRRWGTRLWSIAPVEANAPGRARSSPSGAETMLTPPDGYESTGTAARRLGVGIATARRMAREGRLPAIEANNRVWILAGSTPKAERRPDAAALLAEGRPKAVAAIRAVGLDPDLVLTTGFDLSAATFRRELARYLYGRGWPTPALKALLHITRRTVQQYRDCDVLNPDLRLMARCRAAIADAFGETNAE